MLKARALVFAAACSGLSFCFGIDAALAQSEGAADTSAGDIDPAAVGKIGRVHDNIKRAAAEPARWAAWRRHDQSGGR